MEAKWTSFIKRWWCHCASEDCCADSRDDGLIAPTKARLIDKIEDSDWEMVSRKKVKCPNCKSEGGDNGV